MWKETLIIPEENIVFNFITEERKDEIIQIQHL